MNDKPFAKIGGREVIHQIIFELYNRIFDHPILSQFFVNVDKNQQVNQFTDFMTQILGGPKMYLGREPKHAHPHLFIEAEHFELRHQILADTLRDANLDPKLSELWLSIDRSFAQVIVKNSIDECCKRFNSDQIIAVWSKAAS